jgi:hypothetical protein
LLDWRLIALALGLLGPSGPGLGSPAVAEVAVDGLDVFDEADDRSFAAQRLRRGDRVTIVEDRGDGWLAIEPPPGSLGWIEQGAIREAPGGTGAKVIVPRAVVRSGHPDARMPGPPRLILNQGATVLLLDRPPLKLGRGTSVRTWRAIGPTSGEVRHVRAEGVTRPSAEPAREVRAAYAPPPPVPTDGLSADVAEEITRIEASHRALLRAPIEQWRLDPIRQRYQALLRRVSDSASGNAIRARLDQVGRQEEAARAAQAFQAALDRSRRRDQEVAQFLRRVAQSEEGAERPYDAEGLVQPSSRAVDGQKVFALIGPEGTTLAYLDIPPGLDARPLVARRVGVRGVVHYDENLRARLISVRDLEPLDARR